MEGVDPPIVVAAGRLSLLYLSAAIGYGAYHVAYTTARDEGLSIKHALGTAAIILIAGLYAYGSAGTVTVEPGDPLRPGNAVTDEVYVTRDKRLEQTYFFAGLLLIPALYGFATGLPEYRRAQQARLFRLNAPPGVVVRCVECQQKPAHDRHTCGYALCPTCHRTHRCVTSPA